MKTDEIVGVDMYEKEALFLTSIEEKISDDNLHKEDLKDYIKKLAKSYGKLLKMIRKLTKVGDANQRKLLLAYDEIDNQKKKLDKAYAKLDQLARKDPLTGLSNRRDFLEKVEMERVRYERDKKGFSFVLGDIDDFKSFNDRYGHDCGDFVLEKVAEIFKRSVRKQDFIGRWGGEEFILLLPQSNGIGAVNITEKIRKAIAGNTYRFKDLTLSISMTFGVSVYDGKNDIDSCIKIADEALYIGKQKGKNRVVYKGE